MEFMIILGVAIVCTIVGIAAGYVLGNSRDENPPPEAQSDSSQSSFPPDALHIWRDDNSQNLVLQIGERVVRAPEPFSPTEQRYMRHLLKLLQNWLGIETAQPQRQQPVEQAVHHPQPQQNPEAATVSPFVSEQSESKSIVGQIDDILQEKLAGSPLTDRAIRLMESLDGGMVVYIGMDQYKDIDSIPDENVVALIRAAVQEWEQRQ